MNSKQRSHVQMIASPPHGGVLALDVAGFHAAVVDPLAEVVVSAIDSLEDCLGVTRAKPQQH